MRVTQELGEMVWVQQEGVLEERNESLLRLCAESQKAGGDLTRGGRTGSLEKQGKHGACLWRVKSV